MSYDFKKIIELDLVTEVPEGANVLIETDGATKRVPSTSIKATPIQPDLSQNDPTAPDYVKNRTHYEEFVEKTVEGSGEFELEGFPTFEVGDTVTVKVDGAEYSLVAFDDNGGEAVIGDACSDIDSGTGEHGWQIYTYTGGSGFYGSEGNHTVSFVAETVHKLDKKFLPDDVVNDGSGKIIKLIIDPKYSESSYVFPATDKTSLSDRLTAEDFFALIPYDKYGDPLLYTVVLENRYDGMKYTVIAMNEMCDDDAVEFHIIDATDSGIPTVYYTSERTTNVPV